MCSTCVLQGEKMHIKNSSELTNWIGGGIFISTFSRRLFTLFHTNMVEKKGVIRQSVWQYDRCRDHEVENILDSNVWQEINEPSNEID